MHYFISYKGKRKAFLVHTKKAYTGNRGRAPLLTSVLGGCEW